MSIVFYITLENGPFLLKLSNSYKLQLPIFPKILPTYFKVMCFICANDRIPQFFILDSLVIIHVSFSFFSCYFMWELETNQNHNKHKHTHKSAYTLNSNQSRTSFVKENGYIKLIPLRLAVHARQTIVHQHCHLWIQGSEDALSCHVWIQLNN